MKGYMEDGAFSRGRDVITAAGSVVFVGNIDGDIETIVRTSNLFYPLPKEMDTAFYDRIHAGRIPDFPVTRSHPPASWPSAANSSICRTYRKTAGEESRRRSPVANRWMRP